MEDNRISNLINQAENTSLDELQKTSKEKTTEEILSDVITTSNEVTVGGVSYQIKKYSIKEWLKVTPYLGRMFGVPLSMGVEGSLMEGSEDTIAGSILMLFSNLEGDEFEKLVKVLLIPVLANGTPVRIEDFKEPYDMLQVCMHVLRVNYSDLFTKGIKDLVEMMGKAKAVATTLSH